MFRQTVGILLLILCMGDDKKNMFKGMNNWNAGGNPWGKNPWGWNGQQFKPPQKKENSKKENKKQNNIKKDETQKKMKENKNNEIKTPPTPLSPATFPQPFVNMHSKNVQHWPSPPGFYPFPNSQHIPNPNWKPKHPKPHNSLIKEQKSQAKQQKKQNKTHKEIQNKQQSSNNISKQVQALQTKNIKQFVDQLKSEQISKNISILSHERNESTFNSFDKKDIIDIKSTLPNINNYSDSTAQIKQVIPSQTAPPPGLQSDAFSQSNPKRAHDNNVKGKYNSVMGTGNNVIGNYNIIRPVVKGPDS